MANENIDSLFEARRIEGLRLQHALSQQKWEEQLRIEEAAEAERVKQSQAQAPEKTFSEGPLFWLLKKLFSILAVTAPVVSAGYLLLSVDVNERGLLFVALFWIACPCAIPIACTITMVEEAGKQVRESIRSRRALSERFVAIYGLKIFISIILLSIISTMYYTYTKDITVLYAIIGFCSIFGLNYIIMKYRKNKNYFGNNSDEAEDLVTFLYGLKESDNRTGIKRINPAYIEQFSNSRIESTVFAGQRANASRR